MEEFYRIRQKSTGLFLKGSKTLPPMTKAGAVSKAPRSLWGRKGRIVPFFHNDVPPRAMDDLENELKRIQRWSTEPLDQDDLVLEVAVTVPVNDSKEKLAEIISNIDQDLLAEKLKGNWYGK